MSQGSHNGEYYGNGSAYNVVIYALAWDFKELKDYRSDLFVFLEIHHQLYISLGTGYRVFEGLHINKHLVTISLFTV